MKCGMQCASPANIHFDNELLHTSPNQMPNQWQSLYVMMLMMDTFYSVIHSKTHSFKLVMELSLEYWTWTDAKTQLRLLNISRIKKYCHFFATQHGPFLSPFSIFILIEFFSPFLLLFYIYYCNFCCILFIRFHSRISDFLFFFDSVNLPFLFIST